MTVYGVLMAFGGLILAAIIVKGFWSATRVKPMEQPDNWQSRSGAWDI